MRKFKKKYLVLGAIPIIIFLSFFLFNKGEEVVAIKLQRGNIVRTVEDTGYVQAIKDWDLQAQQSARVAKVLAETGQSVKKGETLVVMENIDLSLQTLETTTNLSQAKAELKRTEASYNKAKLALENGELNYQRQKDLYEKGAISNKILEDALLQRNNLQENFRQAAATLTGSQEKVAGLQAMLEQLKQKEEQLRIISPIDGVILDLNVEAGQAVSPGVSIVKVGNLSSLEIKAYILSDDLGEVKIGQKVRVTAPVLGEQELEGSVTQIYPQAEEKVSPLGIIQRRVPVIISLVQGANLQPGYEVRVAIETASFANRLVLPREAIRTDRDGQKEVLQIVDNKIKVQQVTTGETDRDKMEIISGLKEGQLVLKDVSLNIEENTKVQPVVEND